MYSTKLVNITLWIPNTFQGISSFIIKSVLILNSEKIPEINIRILPILNFEKFIFIMPSAPINSYFSDDLPENLICFA